MTARTTALYSGFSAGLSVFGVFGLAFWLPELSHFVVWGIFLGYVFALPVTAVVVARVIAEREREDIALFG